MNDVAAQIPLDHVADDAAFRYWAFLSYSHADTRRSAWLHRRLETYRVPAPLVGRTTRSGTIPRRLFPIFRDRDELPSTAELNTNLVTALEQSRYLIVICSPRAAASRWVNEEIRLFKAMGREHRILAVIIDGEPNASDKPELGLLECFPPALKHTVDAAGRLTDERVEPVAADLRHGRDGREVASLKVIAGLLGVGFDELRQRDRRRTRQRLALAASATAAALALAAVGMERWLHYDRMRDFADRGRKELLAGNAARAAVYLAESYRLGRDDDDHRFLLWHAMRGIETMRQVVGLRDFAILLAETSDDGKLLAIGLNDQRGAAGLRVLDAATRREVSAVALRQLWVYAEKASWFKFVPGDSSRLAVIAEDRVALLGTSDGAEFWSTKLPPRTAYERWSVSSTAIAIERGGDIFLIDLATGRVRARWPNASDATNVVLSPAGDRLLLIHTTQGSRRGGGLHARLLDTGSGRSLQEFDVDSPLNAWAFDATGSRLALATAAGDVMLVDGATGHVLRSLREPGGVDAVSWSLDGGLLAVGSRDGTIHVFAAESGQLHAVLSGHSAGPVSGGLRFAGDRLVSVGTDQTIRVWDLRFGGRSLAQLDVQQSASSVAVTAGSVFVAGGYPGSARSVVRVFSIDHLPPDRRFRFTTTVPVNVGLTSDAKHLVYGSELGSGGIVDIAAERTIPLGDPDERLVTVLPDPLRFVSPRGVRSTTDGALLVDFKTQGAPQPVFYAWNADRDIALVYTSGTLRRMSLATGVVAWQVPVLGPVHRVHLGLQATVLAVSGGGRADFYDVETGRHLRDLDEHLPIDQEWKRVTPTYTYSVGDGRRAIVTSTLGRIELHDLESGKIDWQLPIIASPETLPPVPFCGGTLLFDRPNARRVNVFSLQTGQLLAVLASDERMRAPQCDPGRGWILTSGYDGMTRIWRASDGTLLWQLRTHQFGTASSHLTEGGTKLITTGGDGTVALWQLGWERRSADEIAASVACRAPWRIDGRELRPRPLADQRCG